MMYTRYWFRKDGTIAALETDEDLAVVEAQAPPAGHTTLIPYIDKAPPILNSSGMRATIRGKKPKTEQGKIVWVEREDVALEKEIQQAKEIALLELVKGKVGMAAKKRIDKRLTEITGAGQS